jgi:hypothetical protein
MPDTDGNAALWRYWTGRLARAGLQVVCEDCSKNLADYPSRICPGCEAYREHTGAIWK